jgi:predicted HicB family RNase H-like nuclease
MMVVARGDPRVSLNLRVSPEIKRQVEEYAQRAGISINAAASVLLAEGLRAERRRDR